jgi:predicted transcriptional regulator
VKVDRGGKKLEKEVRNITLALPRSLLRKVKILAAERETSVSRLLAETLQEIVERDDAYERAYARWREDMKHLRNLGTNGKITWTRDELHERR